MISGPGPATFATPTAGYSLTEVSTTAANLADPELLTTAWDLSPLVDGDEESGVQRQLDEAVRRADAFAEGHAGHVAELDAAGLATAMHELAEINELIGKAGSFASLRFSTDTADPAAWRAPAARPGAGDGDRDQALVLRARVGRAVGRAGRGAGLRRSAGVLRALPAQRPPLPAASALRARGEDPRREGDRQPELVGAPVRRARVGAAGRRSTATRCRSTWR